MLQEILVLFLSEAEISAAGTRKKSSKQPGDLVT